MFEKIIDSFEKLCVQIIIEVILVPITIYRLFRKSTRCYDYVVLEMAKEESDRFKDFLSPIKLSVYTSVIISIFMIDAGGQQSFISRINGLNMVEKALIIFMVNNFTAILFSLFLLCTKREKVNSQAFRTFLFSFVYTSVYTAVPVFFLIISLMTIGQTVNVLSFVNEFETIVETYGRGRIFLLLFVVVGFFVLMCIGLYKTFLSYRHILRANLTQNARWITLIALLMFCVQLFFVSKVL